MLYFDPKAAVTIGASFAGAISFCAAVYGWGKWLHRPRPSGPPASPAPTSVEQDERLRRIEAAVETMAVEVERIGEGQRFTTRLLAERGPEPSVERPASERHTYRPAVTPH